MGDYKLTPECITAYGRYLKQEEKSTATQEKYRGISPSLSAGWAAVR